jgi:acyl-coenzyme A thioesterase 9
MNVFQSIASRNVSLRSHRLGGGGSVSSIRLSSSRIFSSSSNDNGKGKDKDGGTKVPLENSNSMFISHLKNPIVHKLWTARQAAKQKTPDPDIRRTPSQSQTDISYPFSTDKFLKETYRNPWGQMRFGKILEDLDALAGNIAFAHVQDPHMNLVTASVDRIRLRTSPNLETDQHLQGSVTYVGTSSMEIRMQCRNQGNKPWMEAYFTFVATDPVTKKPVQIPPIHPETALEQVHFQAGQRRAERKKRARSTKATMDTDTAVDTVAKALLQEAGPLLNMPSLADPNSILSSSTKMQNAQIAQPQVRNLSNKIFGGFLMRRAFELAYATCYMFGGARPRFLEVDDVSFQSPVDVGDLVVFNSRVLYTAIHDGASVSVDYDDLYLVGSGSGSGSGSTSSTDQQQQEQHVPLVTIQVEAWIAEPEQKTAKISNQFYFTFALPANASVRRVLPSNIDEARSMAWRMEADRIQEQE